MECAPCKDCHDRYLGCHGKCPAYQEFRAKKDKELDENIKRRQFHDIFYKYERRRGWQ